MSTPQCNVLRIKQFAERFAEICGTSKPAEVAKILDISYQASKNYLSGKIPNTQTLINISEKTACSIDWLLLGEGKKFIKDNLKQDTLQLSDEIKLLIRDECKKIFAEMIENPTETAKEKIIVLRPEDIKEERVMDETPALPLEDN